MARALLELVGDADSLLKTFRKSSDAADKFGKDMKQLGTTAEQSARAQIQAAQKRDARLRQEIAVYRQVAQAAQKGSREQVAAANLAIRAEERLARSLAVTSREAKEHARSIERSNRQLGKFGRGAFAGSGLAGGLGRTLAFASGGFLATASITGGIRASIREATEQAVAQRQLAAQFRASGQSLAAYNAQIKESVNRLSILAGIEDDEVLSSFTLAFRATRNVTEGLRLTAIAADVAKARNISLAQATLALNKAYGGNVGALRRLGVTIPNTLDGMQALEYVARRFAGQAAAGTTQQQRFDVALKNTEQVIGTALLPTFNHYLKSLTDWLSKSENQARIQKDVAQGVRIMAGAFKVLAESIGLAVSAGEKLQSFLKIFGDAGNKGLIDIIKGSGSGNDALRKALDKAIATAATRNADRTPTGEDVAQRGAAARAARAAGSTASGRGRRASLTYQLSLLDEKLARAELTAGQKDDRAILVRMEALTRQKIAKTKDLGERTRLLQSLVSIEGQIASIDQDTAKKRSDAQKKQQDAAKKRLADEKTAATKELATLKQREANLRQTIKNIMSTFSQTVATARAGIGDLFGGPVLNFSEEQRRAALGIPNTAADPRALVRDLNAQVRQATVFQKNLARLGRRGAPAELIKELQAGGLSNATQVAALAGASKGTLQQFFKAFGAREHLVQRIARAQMHAQLVNLHATRVRLTDVRAREQKIQVFIDGVEQKQGKVKVKQSAAQRRGPVPGRVGNFGNVVG